MSGDSPYEVMGPGFLLFFLDYESELEVTTYGGGPVPMPSEKVSFKIEDDEIAIALSLLLARRY